MTRLYRFITVALLAALVIALAPVFSHAEAAGGGVIAYGDVVSGQIDNANYYELWQFDGSKGDRVRITMTGSGGLDTYLGLIELASEEVVTEDDDSAGNGNAMIDTTLPSSGSFVIVATRYDLENGKSQGQYSLELAGGSGPTTTTVSNTTTTEPVELEPGVYYMGDMVLATPVSGAIESESYAHLYSIEVDAGTDLIVGMFADDGSTLDTYLMFATEEGDVLAEDDDSGADVGGSKTDSFIRLTVSQTGIYYIIATRAGIDAGKSSGGYALIAGVPEEEQPEPASSSNDLPEGVEFIGAVAVGSSSNGAITADSYIHLYTFDGSAGEMVTITMTGQGSLDTYLGIIDSNDEVIAEDDDSGGGMNAQIALRLPETGTYIIVATRNGLDSGTTTGAYTLTLTDGSPAPADTSGPSIGGFGGLPGRAVQSGDTTFWLRGYAPSDNPDKGSGLQGVCQGGALPGRTSESQCYGPVVNNLSLNFEEIK